MPIYRFLGAFFSNTPDLHGLGVVGSVCGGGGGGEGKFVPHTIQTSVKFRFSEGLYFR